MNFIKDLTSIFENIRKQKAFLINKFIDQLKYLRQSTLIRMHRSDKEVAISERSSSIGKNPTGRVTSLITMISSINSTASMSLLCILILGSLAGCHKKKTVDPEATQPISYLYNLGKERLEKKDYTSAAESFKMIFEQHPDGKVAPYSELIYGYSLYKAEKYDDAINVFANYLEYFPVHEDSPYALYMICLSYYDQIRDISRDQNNTLQSLKAFEEFKERIKLQPNSKNTERYYSDLLNKMKLVRDYLAAEQLSIGLEYMSWRNPIAGIIRFKRVLDYPTTVHIPEALYRLTECYIILGLEEEASKYFGLLSSKYPTDSWHQLGLLNFAKYSWSKKYILESGASIKDSGIVKKTSSNVLKDDIKRNPSKNSFVKKLTLNK